MQARPRNDSLVGKAENVTNWTVVDCGVAVLRSPPQSSSRSIPWNDPKSNQVILRPLPLDTGVLFHKYIGASDRVPFTSAQYLMPLPQRVDPRTAASPHVERFVILSFFGSAL
jgi:hypothetical protein